MPKRVKVFVLVATVVALFYGLVVFFISDSCLDQGGSWNYLKHSCDM
jgi:hypothetical protein